MRLRATSLSISVAHVIDGLASERFDLEHQCLPDPELRNAQLLLYLCVSQRKERTSSDFLNLELASKIMEVDAYIPQR